MVRQTGPKRYDRAAWVGLVVGSLVLVVVFAGYFALRFPLGPNLDRPLLDLGKLDGYGPAALFRTVTILGAGWLGYELALWSIQRLGGLAWRWILGTGFMAQIVLVFAYPVVAADIFNYILQGRLLALYGLNPMTAVPSAGGDPWLSYSPFPNMQLAYGPAWAVVAAGLSRLAVDDLPVTVLAFKLVAVAVNLVNAGLLWLVARQRRPGSEPMAVAVYLLNPLVIFETVANGHNDGLVVLPMLLAVWLVGRAPISALAAPAALAMSVVFKYVSLPLLFPVAWGVWYRTRGLLAVGPAQSAAVGDTPLRRVVAVAGRHFWGSLPAAIALEAGLLLIVLGFLPFWTGPETLAGLRRQAEEVTTSLPSVLAANDILGWGRERWRDVLRPVTTLVVIAVAVWRRPGSAGQVAAACFDLLLVQLLVATFWFQPWYVVPLVGLAAASDDAWRRRLALAFATGATASYLVYFFVWVSPWWGVLSFGKVQFWAVVAAYGPVLVLLAWRSAAALRKTGRTALR